MNDTSKEFLKSIIASGARHVLSAAAVWLVGNQMLTASDQQSFVTMGTGVVMGAVAAAWTWYDKVGREQLHDTIKNLQVILAQRAEDAKARAANAQPPRPLPPQPPVA